MPPLAPIVFFSAMLGLLGLLLALAEKYLAAYGVCAVDINAGERRLEIEGGDTLLEALYEADIFIPSACGGRGTCGSCKIVVNSGAGPLLPTERPYLERAEIRRGVRLACQVKIRGDIAVDIPEAYLRVERFRAVVDETRLLIHDTKLIRLRLVEPERIAFRAGQYIQVEVPTGSGPTHRAYSITDPEGETGTIELVVKLIPGGVGSTYLHGLAVNQELTFVGPFGEFVMSEDPARELVCVAGGCGIAPLLSLTRTSLARMPERGVRLFFGCRSSKELMFTGLLREMADKNPSFSAVYSLEERDAGAPEGCESGFIHQAVAEHLSGLGRRQAFVCGPEAMLEAVIETLAAKGLPKREIYFDRY